MSRISGTVKTSVAATIPMNRHRAVQSRPLKTAAAQSAAMTTM